MSSALKYLTHVSFKDAEPYWEDFAELCNLYLDHKPTIIGYRGNLYAVSLRSTWNEYAPDIIRPPYERFGNLDYFNKRFRVSIFDLVNSRTIGDGTFDIAFPSMNCHAMPEVKRAIERAIVTINMKSTDYYK